MQKWSCSQCVTYTTCHIPADSPREFEVAARSTTTPTASGSSFSFSESCARYVCMFNSMMEDPDLFRHPHHQGQRQQEMTQIWLLFCGFQIMFMGSSFFLLTLPWPPSSFSEGLMSWTLSSNIRNKYNKLTEMLNQLPHLQKVKTLCQTRLYCEVP